MREAIKTAPRITIITSLFLKFSEEKTNPEKENVTKKVTTNIAIATPLVTPSSSLFLLLFICKSFLKIYISRKNYIINNETKSQNLIKNRTKNIELFG